ncbi:MAG: hypothetical protein IKU92_00665 [Rikenellaceae bacterium]|nr:hypothetical protein [Rikenellaceae bacterium]
MHINDIKILVARLGAIVEGWDEQSGAPAVERHIAASLLAELYEAVKFDTALAATEVAKVAEETVPVEEPVEDLVEESQSEEQVAEVIDLSDIFGGSLDDEIDEVEKPVAEVIVADGESEEIAETVVEVAPAEEPISEEVAEPTESEEEPMISEEPAPIEEAAPVVEEEVASVVEEEIVPAVEEEMAPATEEVSAVEEEIVPVVEEEPAPAVEETPVIEEDKAPEVEEEKITMTQASLFDMEVVRRPRSSSGRRVIMSLYGESTPASQTEKPEKVEKVEAPVAPKSTPIEEPAPEPIVPKKEELSPENAAVAVSVAERIAAAQSESQPQILGEVIGAGTTTLAEAVAASQPTVQTVQNDRVNSLRSAIGINDRFILIRDLFGGDGDVFDRVIEQLDSFDDFNECLVYMSEYRWNPNSDGARLLMDLVTRKLL